MDYHFKILNKIKLFPIYYDLIISAQFATCADAQLPENFKKLTGIDVKKGITLLWDQDIKTVYEKGKTSHIMTRIGLRYGSIQVKIVWRSKSGRIYDIADENIDCTDIEFWFEGIDAEYCYKRMYPKWTLLTFPESTAKRLKEVNDVDISVEFLQCADKQLSYWFERVTDMKINKEICLTIRDKEDFAYVAEIISALAVTLYINHNWNHDLAIVWTSKSGRIYKISDTDIDCNDLEFRLEGEDIDPLKYYKQMFPKTELPFKLKNLSYQLVINRLNMNCTMEMTLKENEIPNGETYMETINTFIDRFNEQSVKKDREDGVVHNWRSTVEKNKLIYEIDTGFAGPALMKKLLPFLSSLESFTAVEIN